MTASINLDSKAVAESYSIAQFANDFSELATSRSGAEDLIEAVINACDWMAHLGVNKELAESTSSTLEPIGQSFSIMGLIEHLNGLRDQFRVSDIKDSDALKKDVFKHTVLGAASGAKLAMFLQGTGLYVFKEGMKSIKTVFWASLGVFDLVNLYSGVGAIKEFRAQIDSTMDQTRCEILNSKINLTYLQMIQSATLVAMAAISLVSIVFGSMAQGVLFNPVAMLGLSSSWLALQFVTHFYEKVIVHKEAQIDRPRLRV